MPKESGSREKTMVPGGDHSSRIRAIGICNSETNHLRPCVWLHLGSIVDAEVPGNLRGRGTDV